MESTDKSRPIVITFEQLEADSNHYFWRAEHGEVFGITKKGVVVATLRPPSPTSDQAAKRGD